MGGKMRPGAAVVILALTLSVTLTQADPDSPYTWACREKVCKKLEKIDLEPGETSAPLDICRLNCEDYGSLWPKPTGKVELGKSVVSFYPQNVIFTTKSASSAIHALQDEAVKIFREYLLKYHPDYKNDGVSPFPRNEEGDPTISGNSFVIDVATVWEENVIKIGSDESYILSLQVNDQKNNVSAIIAANTYFGSRHGLETLSQLIAYDDDNNCLKTLDRATVSDGPVFTHRGISLDTSRNFFPIDSLKRVIDGMSYSKLNVFKWHITDTHSFPFFSKSVPEMTKYGAYSSREVYTVQEMTDFVEYARIRGVKVVAELDAPAHTGNGWNWGPGAGKGEMVLCANKEPWMNYCVEPPCGQLNPANENMYEVLGRIYRDMLEIFDNEMFHMGGDEVKLDCWLENAEITEYLRKQGKNNTKETLIGLWAEFQDKAYDLVKANQKDPSNNVSAVLWTSELASEAHLLEFLPKEKYVIQIWSTATDKIIPFLIKNGYRTIFSNYDAWYLDCGYGGWIGAGNNWCSPYKGWQKVYENSPMKLLESELTPEEIQKAYRDGLILGGETPLWTEQVDHHAVEGKLWPRASALAERLWTNPDTNWFLAEPRMVQNRNRYAQRGIHADRLQPEWCRQNEQLCYG